MKELESLNPNRKYLFMRIFVIKLCIKFLSKFLFITLKVCGDNGSHPFYEISKVTLFLDCLEVFFLLKH